MAGRWDVSKLEKALEQYLALRRALGFQLGRTETRLRQFLAFLEGKQTTRITTALALEFAMEASELDPRTKAHRLSVVRGFARHLAATDPTMEIPPLGLLPSGLKRAHPYLYSEEELRRLLAGAKAYPSWSRFPGLPWNRFQAQTYYCLFGLLAVTGMRVGEALKLRPGDIDWKAGVLTIHHAKFGKSRLVPLHPTTMKALGTFVRHRDRFFAQLLSPPKLAYLFVTSRGTPIRVTYVNRVFLTISRQIGLRAPNAHRGPRLHDLRHRFAVETLLRWYRQGEQPDRLLPVLATYLGHTHVSGTYWYLSSTPELMRVAGQRLERRWKGVR
jgi:integrase/recombinase XerD